MLDYIHLKISNGETDDQKQAIHVIGIKTADLYSLVVSYVTNAGGKSWFDDGPTAGQHVDRGEFWHDLTEGAIFGIVENFTRNTGQTPDDFLAAPENFWMNRITPEDFAPDRWNDATKL